MGAIQRAKGAVRWIYIGQSWANLSNLILAYVFISSIGVPGVAYAYLFSVAIHSLVVFFIAKHLSGFAWSRASFRLVALSICMVLVGLGIKQLPGNILPLSLGTVLVAIACVASMRGIVERLGDSHRIVMMVCIVPGGRMICGLK